jgi:hypothetical protein
VPQGRPTECAALDQLLAARVRGRAARWQVRSSGERARGSVWVLRYPCCQRRVGDGARLRRAASVVRAGARWAPAAACSPEGGAGNGVQPQFGHSADRFLHRSGGVLSLLSDKPRKARFSAGSTVSRRRPWRSWRARWWIGGIQHGSTRSSPVHGKEGGRPLRRVTLPSGSVTLRTRGKSLGPAAFRFRRALRLGPRRTRRRS